jgi:hypothetical protein
MANLVHVLLSEAGEPEAGPTEFGERIVYEEAQAAQAFSEMEAACERFIESQIEIISSNEAMREYNELTYGAVGGGYFYRISWLVFPDPPKELSTPNELLAHYLSRTGSDDPQLENYLRRQVGHDSNLDALEALAEQFGGTP